MIDERVGEVWPGPCRSCRSENVVVGETGSKSEFEAKCFDCNEWFDPDSHPAGCFYGSFARAYPDAWHIPFNVVCDFPHGEDAIQLKAPK